MGSKIKKFKKRRNKGNNIVDNIKNDRQTLIMQGLITSLEILKRDFNFTEAQVKEFSDKYLPELKNQMNKHK